MIADLTLRLKLQFKVFLVYFKGYLAFTLDDLACLRFVFGCYSDFLKFWAMIHLKDFVASYAVMGTEWIKIVAYGCWGYCKL